MARPPYNANEITQLIARIRLQVGIGLRNPSEREFDEDAPVTLRKGQWHELLACVDWLLRQHAGQKRRDASLGRIKSYLAVVEKLEQARRNGTAITESEAIQRVGGTTTRRHYYAIKKDRELPEFPE